MQCESGAKSLLCFMSLLLENYFEISDPGTCIVVSEEKLDLHAFFKAGNYIIL